MSIMGKLSAGGRDSEELSQGEMFGEECRGDI